MKKCIILIIILLSLSKIEAQTNKNKIISTNVPVNVTFVETIPTNLTDLQFKIVEAKLKQNLADVVSTNTPPVVYTVDNINEARKEGFIEGFTNGVDAAEFAHFNETLKSLQERAANIYIKSLKQ